MNRVAQLFKAFGGIRKAQKALGEKHASTLQSWQTLNNIPHYREAQVRAAVIGAGIEIADSLLDNLFPPKRAASKRRRASGVGLNHREAA